MSKEYTRNTWVNDAPPAINATNLNNVEEGVLTNNRLDLSVVVTPLTDADYTLTTEENQYGRIEVDTTNWTTARNIIINNDEHTFLAVVNNTGSQNATFKTSAGTGIEVVSGVGLGKTLRNDTVNVIEYEATLTAETRLNTLSEAYSGQPAEEEILQQDGGFIKSQCVAWVLADMTGTPSIIDSFNVASVSKSGTGINTATLDFALDNTNFSGAGTARFAAGNASNINVSVSAESTTTFRFDTYRTDNTVFDSDRVFVVIFGGRS